MSNPSDHEQPEILAHHITITAVIPLPITDPATWDVRSLLQHLDEHTDQISEVTSFRLIKDPASESTSGPEVLPW